MQIPSIRTRQDMRAAAELRAAGATWETIAVATRRQPNLLTRWARIYCEDWSEFFAAAEQRQAGQMDAASRAALRSRLRGKNLSARLDAAEQLLRQVPEEKFTAPPSAVANLAGFKSYFEGLSEEEQTRFIEERIN